MIRHPQLDIQPLELLVLKWLTRCVGPRPCDVAPSTLQMVKGDFSFDFSFEPRAQHYVPLWLCM